MRCKLIILAKVAIEIIKQISSIIITMSGYQAKT